MEDFFKVNGIRHQTTIPHTPQQNGVAEHANRIIIEKATCMLQESGLNKRFWEEVVRMYLKNRSPSKAVKSKTSYEIWTNQKVDLRHLRVYGCKVYMHIEKQ